MSSGGIPIYSELVWNGAAATAGISDFQSQLKATQAAVDSLTDSAANFGGAIEAAAQLGLESTGRYSAELTIVQQQLAALTIQSAGSGGFIGNIGTGTGAGGGTDPGVQARLKIAEQQDAEAANLEILNAWLEQQSDGLNASVQSWLANKEATDAMTSQEEQTTAWLERESEAMEADAEAATKLAVERLTMRENIIAQMNAEMEASAKNTAETERVAALQEWTAEQIQLRGESELEMSLKDRQAVAANDELIDAIQEEAFAISERVAAERAVTGGMAPLADATDEAATGLLGMGNMANRIILRMAIYYGLIEADIHLVEDAARDINEAINGQNATTTPGASPDKQNLEIAQERYKEAQEENTWYRRFLERDPFNPNAPTPVEQQETYAAQQVVDAQAHIKAEDADAKRKSENERLSDAQAKKLEEDTEKYQQHRNDVNDMLAGDEVGSSMAPDALNEKRIKDSEDAALKAYKDNQNQTGAGEALYKQEKEDADKRSKAVDEYIKKQQELIKQTDAVMASADRAMQENESLSQKSANDRDRAVAEMHEQAAKKAEQAEKRGAFSGNMDSYLDRIQMGVLSEDKTGAKETKEAAKEMKEAAKSLKDSGKYYSSKRTPSL